MGKKLKKRMDIGMCITDSLSVHVKLTQCCRSNIITTNLLKIKRKKIIRNKKYIYSHILYLFTSYISVICL